MFNLFFGRKAWYGTNATATKLVTIDNNAVSMGSHAFMCLHMAVYVPFINTTEKYKVIETM